MMGFNPFHEWWKRDGYVSWPAYLMWVPFITIVIVIAWIVITIGGPMLGLLQWIKNKTKTLFY
ncbi:MULTISPECIES: hypothetical protein [Bacillus]|uniref:Uncharacterized protein n=1 Tax=Bacillus cereus TaxID=1396 RepID=A0A9X6GDX5_BACCE|nr:MULTISPECIES: hypothetical protein [Bacillus cereus group]MBG9520721.1 hypothetical protein [Bacillus thuringiensis]MBG9521035.1 hypothetical protein [Bacillus thuringiensis]MBG9522191.1 hypothetical protein [Bacillus thuringiensis]OOR72451.1 hypothetical protein BLX06_24795 [Bacillus cereus]